MGLDGRRLEMFYVGASDAPLWRDKVKLMTERALELGPNPLGKPAVEEEEAAEEALPVRALAI